MKNNLLIVSLLLAAVCQTSRSQTITEWFGGVSDVNRFSIEFVQVGSPGNAADTTGIPNPAGYVPYLYNIGKYEVSREVITKVNEASGLNITLADMSAYNSNGQNKPAAGLSWYEAALFVNYLNISQGYNAAYKFGGAPVSGNPYGFQLWNTADVGFQANNPFRNSLAKYVIPSADEWYKAAYGSPGGDWFDYSTGSNSLPDPVSNGTNPGSSVYGGQSGLADISDAGGLSPYGTMAQGGNVWEWTETNNDQSNDSIEEFRMRKGGGWHNPNDTLASTWFDSGVNPDREHDLIGLRVAMVPEPSALSLLAVGLGGLAILRRRRS